MRSSSINLSKISQTNLISYVIWRLAIESIESIPRMIYAFQSFWPVQSVFRFFFSPNIYEQCCLEIIVKRSNYEGDEKHAESVGILNEFHWQRKRNTILDSWDFGIALKKRDRTRR